MCGQQRPPSVPEGGDDADRKEIERQRLEKDEFFKTDPRSPIPWAARSKMAGLEYFPVDPRYRFRVKLTRYPKPEPVVLATSKGVPRNMVRYGFFEFAVEGQPRRLQVYRSLDPDPYLFVPFRDATSGRETYGAGRYLDLEARTGDDYVLDFNVAYNPYCAYSNDYVCPFPPRENWLDIPIRAGEKDFPFPPEADDAKHS